MHFIRQEYQDKIYNEIRDILILALKQTLYTKTPLALFKTADCDRFVII